MRGTGRERLHPQDGPIIGTPGLFHLSNGDVDLSIAPGDNVPSLRRRVENENATDLRARLKRESRHEGRTQRRNAAKRAAKARAKAL